MTSDIRDTNDTRDTQDTRDGNQRFEEGFDERLRAVERALTGTDASVAAVANDAAAAEERAALDTRVDDLTERVEELEAATQALRGYAGAIRAVNREVERRADLALARASGDDETPSEAALDAALPSDRHEASDSEGGTDRDDGGDERGSTDTEGSRSNDYAVLGRLRESL
ncbi:hypothetical protein [Halorubrum sp. CBA1125]|uniref:DUF7310 family coiled-coil domain-containing protein n=1 Tax=Halorubrum sp. CBA1125 TaxID=2668072 RepID=UPI002AA2AA78|nr:hypothetical protein [Halorubrum sp. CBA1125]